MAFQSAASERYGSNLARIPSGSIQLKNQLSRQSILNKERNTLSRGTSIADTINSNNNIGRINKLYLNNSSTNNQADGEYDITNQ